MLNRLFSQDSRQALSKLSHSIAAILASLKIGDLALRYKQISDLLKEIRIQADSNWNKANRLITSLNMGDIDARLQLYSAKEDEEIDILEKNIYQIKIFKNVNDNLIQKIDLIKFEIKKSNFIDKIATKSLEFSMDHVKRDNKFLDYQLKIAQLFCKTLIYRKQKKFYLAINSVNQWIDLLQTYQQYLNYFQPTYSTENVNDILVSAYNHKAKIHRALAGFDLENLDMKQLELSKKSYLDAIAIKKDKIILNCLGFLLNDISNMLPSKEAEILLNAALAYHNEALLIDDQYSYIYHGIGYALYKIEYRRYSAGLNIDINKLKDAINAFTFAEQKMSKPSARLYLDKGLTHALLGENANAMACYNKGLLHDASHALLRLHRGILYLQNDHMITALEDLRYGRAVSINSKSMLKVFDDKIIIAINRLKEEYKNIPEKNNLDELDIRKIAKQAAFETALNKIANHVFNLRNKSHQTTLFISYARGNKEHPHYAKQIENESKIEKLAKELSMAGFKVLFDKWYEVKGKDIMGFIEKIHGESDYILVIGTHYYLEKYKKISELGKPDPIIKTEASLINYMIRFNEFTKEKVIPVVLEGPAEKSLPPILLPKDRIDFERENYYDEIFKLICTLHHLKYSDEQLKKIVNNFNAVVAEIDQATQKAISERYKDSIRESSANIFHAAKIEAREGINHEISSALLRSNL